MLRILKVDYGSMPTKALRKTLVSYGPIDANDFMEDAKPLFNDELYHQYIGDMGFGMQLEKWIRDNCNREEAALVHLVYGKNTDVLCEVGEYTDFNGMPISLFGRSLHANQDVLSDVEERIVDALLAEEIY